RPEGLVHAAQHVLAGREVGERQRAVRADRLQLVGLLVVADRAASLLPGIATLLERAVIQPARLINLGVEQGILRAGRIEPVCEGASKHACPWYTERSVQGVRSCCATARSHSCAA